jgi:hypothetical protein
VRGDLAVAPELVSVLFGPKWLAAVPALVILPLIVPVRMACSVLFTTSLALGNRQLDLRNTIANFVLIPGGFYVGAHWGMLGLCLAWLVSVPLAYAFSVPTIVRFIGIRPRELIKECGAPASAALAMYAAIVALRPSLAGLPSIGLLFALVGAGGLAYVLIVALISPHHLASVRRALAAGVRIAAGTDAGGHAHPPNALEIRYLVEAGLTPMQALQAATGWAAECIGRAGEIGTVSAGALADLVLVDGDPLHDVTLLQDLDRIRLVLKGGQIAVDRRGGVRS